MQILPNLHKIPGVTANTFLIIDPDGLTLVDSGLPRSQSRILRYVEDLGFSAADLKRILITHADSDHIGALAALQKTSQAKVFASAPETVAITDGRASRPLKLSGLSKWLLSAAMALFPLRPAWVDEIVTGGGELPCLGGLQVLETPGHTPGHTSYYAPAEAVLFCGDSLRVVTGRVVVSKGFNTWDEARALESARLQAKLGARVVCAGHGEILRDEAGVQFPSFLEHGSGRDLGEEGS